MRKITTIMLALGLLLTGCSQKEEQKVDNKQEQLDKAKEKLNEVKDQVENVVEKNKDSINTVKEKVKEVKNNVNKEYNRKDYKHWIPAFKNNPNWTVREEVLRKQAIEIVIVDKNGKETKDLYKADKIKSGKWIDPYSGKTFTNPKDMDIDHIVPLSYAHKHGASEWNSEMKTQFANDYENLLAVSAKENRKKGDKGLSEYMPPLKSFHNEYVEKFNYVIEKYNLK